MLTEKSMLTTPVRPTTLSRTESFENPPCPPYNLSQEDVLAQAPIAEEDDPWTEIDRIQDPRALKERFYAEQQLMRDQLNLAGQFGLELQHSLEQAQYAERQSYAQIQALQDENIVLQTRIQHSQALSAHLTGSEHEVQNLTSENESLQKELDGCRRELKTFRRELDDLVEQMADMGSEVVDAKNKVTVYSRRLNEVEQELSTTQELNINLQEQLQVTLEKQKQAQTTTALAVKSMQSELGRVVSDSGSIRSTLEELESRQEKCEGKVVEMFSNTKEYAQLLEEAQSTIQTMRIESDMDGRGWGDHSPSGWNPQMRRSTTGQLSTLAMEDPELKARDISTELDSWGDDQAVTSGMSLGMELGLETNHNNDGRDSANTQTIEQSQGNIFSSPPSTPVSTQPSESSKQLTPAPSPINPLEKHNKETQTPVPPPQQQQQQPTPPMPKDAKRMSSGTLSTDLQQRLEEHNILQTAYSASPASSRPPWNPSVALEGMPVAPARSNRSRSASRGPTSASSRSSSRSISQASLYNIVSPSTSSAFRSGRPNQATPQSTASTISSQDSASVNSGRRQGSLSVKNDRRPRSQTTANTIEKNPTPGLRYLLSPDNSTGEMANVITKTKTSAPSKAGSVSSITARNSTKPAGENSNTRPKKRIVASSSSNSLNSTNSKTGSIANKKSQEEMSRSSTSQNTPFSPAHSIKKKGSTASLSVSPGALTTTTTTTSGTGRTTPRSHPMSPSPRAISRASMSSTPSSPTPVSPSIASKKLRAISGSGSVTIKGEAGSRRSSVISPPPLPLPLPTEVTADDTLVADSEETKQ
ncbi:hypothetical protein BGZ76_009403 [Entomortierella beljakovae]|nr:hypothetical protein BGZ76_009403 [Entomortierella beljakovae]